MAPSVARMLAPSVRVVDIRNSATNVTPVLVKANLRCVPLSCERRRPMTTAPTTMPSSIGVRWLPAPLADIPLPVNSHRGTNSSAV